MGTGQALEPAGLGQCRPLSTCSLLAAWCLAINLSSVDLSVLVYTKSMPAVTTHFRDSFKSFCKTLSMEKTFRNVSCYFHYYVFPKESGLPEYQGVCGVKYMKR